MGRAWHTLAGFGGDNLVRAAIAGLHNRGLLGAPVIIIGCRGERAENGGSGGEPGDGKEGVGHGGRRRRTIRCAFHQVQGRLGGDEFESEMCREALILGSE